MVEKPWNKEKSRIKSIKPETKKIIFPTLHARIIWKCWSMIGTHLEHIFLIPEEKLLNSFEFHSWYKFPVERSEYSDNTGPFSPKKPQVFHGERMEMGRGFFRRRISNSISNPRKCTYRGIWRRLRRVNRYVSTVYLHTCATSRVRRERKVSFLHLREENFGLEPWDNSFHIFFENLKKLLRRNEDESWISRYLQRLNRIWKLNISRFEYFLFFFLNFFQVLIYHFTEITIVFEEYLKEFRGQIDRDLWINKLLEYVDCNLSSDGRKQCSSWNATTHVVSTSLPLYVGRFTANVRD